MAGGTLDLSSLIGTVVREAALGAARGNAEANSAAFMASTAGLHDPKGTEGGGTGSVKLSDDEKARLLGWAGLGWEQEHPMYPFYALNSDSRRSEWLDERLSVDTADLSRQDKHYINEERQAEI